MDLVNLKDYQFSYYLEWKQNKDPGDFCLKQYRKERDGFLSESLVSFTTLTEDCLTCEMLFIQSVLEGILFMGWYCASFYKFPSFSFLCYFHLFFLSLCTPSHTEPKKNGCSLSLWPFLHPPNPCVLPASTLEVGYKNSRLSKRLSNGNKLEGFPLKLCMFVDILLKVLYVKKSFKWS